MRATFVQPSGAGVATSWTTSQARTESCHSSVASKGALTMRWSSVTLTSGGEDFSMDGPTAPSRSCFVWRMSSPTVPGTRSSPASRPMLSKKALRFRTEDDDDEASSSAGGGGGNRGVVRTSTSGDRGSNIAARARTEPPGASFDGGLGPSRGGGGGGAGGGGGGGAETTSGGVLRCSKSAARLRTDPPGASLGGGGLAASRGGIGGRGRVVVVVVVVPATTGGGGGGGSVAGMATARRRTEEASRGGTIGGPRAGCRGACRGGSFAVVDTRTTGGGGGGGAWPTGGTTGTWPTGTAGAIVQVRCLLLFHFVQ
mmetsp:Transcript_24109/g.77755  ORF Transcript_24109/g.77755 Transcript_24109/m.77755 type:complete len:313 (+) Transcript_24109:466-1404(+)